MPGYHTLLATGLVLAGSLSVLRGRQRGWLVPVVLDAILVAAVTGVLLGRAVYVAANWTYFRDHLVEAPQVWRGGLSAHGVLLGAVGSLLLYCRLRGIDPWALLDLLVPGGALVATSAWLGCLQAGCAWGPETGPDQGPLWVLSAELPDIYGQRTPRIAVQAIGAAWNSLVFGTALAVRRSGVPFSLWLLLYTAGDFVLGLLRADPLPRVGCFTVPQMADIAVLLLALALWAWPTRRSDRGE